MNNQPVPRTRKGPAVSALKSFALLSIGLLFGWTVWMAALPAAVSAAVTPAEMIQMNLPHSMSLATAGRPDVLSAVCKAVTSNQKDAPEIVRTAAGARKEFTADILKTAVHCLHSEKEQPDCATARSALDQAIAVDAEQADSLTELFIGLTPTCVDSPEEGPATASNINGPPGSVGGGTQAAVAGPCTVCHNNQSIQVPCAGVDNYLGGHPGDTAGACEATPNANP